MWYKQLQWYKFSFLVYILQFVYIVGCLKGEWCGTTNCSGTVYSFRLFMSSSSSGNLKFWNDGGDTDEFTVVVSIH